MRVFTAVRHSVDQKHYYGGLWKSNFYPALQQLDCEVVESQVDLLPASRFMQIAAHFTPQEQELRANITQKIIDEVTQAHQKKPIDLFLSYFYNSHFDPAGFEEIHRLGISTVNFFCNSIYQFELVAEIAPKVTFSWHSEREAKSSYLSVGANPVWVQMGADPEVYYPVATLTRTSKACFIGQRYADRDQLLSALIQEDIPVHIYGKGWGYKESISASKSQAQQEESSYLGRKLSKPGSLKSYAGLVAENMNRQGYFWGLQRTIQQFSHRRHSKTLNPMLASAACGYAGSISQTFASYELILNFSNVWSDGRPASSLIPHVRLRDFEAPMSRTCYLTGYTEEIEEFYELGKEIDTYNSIDELIDKTKYYLDHSSEAECLRSSGYERSLRDHTWVRRFQQLFKAIGLSA